MTTGSKMNRRFKILYVDEQVMIDLMHVITQQPGDSNQIVLPKLTGIPEGIEAVSVNYDAGMRAFAVGVYHESFHSLAMGERPEVVGSDVESVQYYIEIQGQ